MRSGKRPLTTSDKVVLLLSLIPYLRENGATSVDKVAEHFEVAPEIIVKLAKFLGTAGIPGETLTYQHEDLYDINWDALENDNILELVATVAVEESPRFSGAEYAALIAGTQILSHYIPEDLLGDLDSLKNKLSLSSTGDEDTLSSHETTVIDAPVREIFVAINENRAIKFSYVARNLEETVRVVDPIEITQIGALWYFSGYCYHRSDFRTFRIESISELETLKQKRSHTELEKTEIFNAETGIDIEVLAGSRAIPLLGDWAPVEIEKIKNGSKRLRVHLLDISAVTRLVSVAPGEIEVIEPAIVRNIVSNWANDIITSGRIAS